MGGIDETGFRIHWQLGNQLEGRVELSGQLHDGLKELPETLAGCHFATFLGGANGAIQMDDILAYRDDVLAGLYNFGHFFGHRRATGINSIYIFRGRYQNLNNCFHRTINSANCRQNFHKNVLHCLDEAIIAIELHLLEVKGALIDSVGLKLRRVFNRENIKF